MLKIYTNNNFTGHWSVGTSAVVIAESPEEATEMLNKELKDGHHLDGDAEVEDMRELVIDRKKVVVLNNGDY